jgi:hypothetical protein
MPTLAAGQCPVHRRTSDTRISHKPRKQMPRSMKLLPTMKPKVVASTTILKLLPQQPVPQIIESTTQQLKFTPPPPHPFQKATSPRRSRRRHWHRLIFTWRSQTPLEAGGNEASERGLQGGDFNQTLYATYFGERGSTWKYKKYYSPFMDCA